MFLLGLWEDPRVSLADYPEMLKVWELMEMIPEVFETFQYTMIYTSDKVIRDPHIIYCIEIHKRRAYIGYYQSPLI